MEICNKCGKDGELKISFYGKVFKLEKHNSSKHNEKIKEEFNSFHGSLDFQLIWKGTLYSYLCKYEYINVCNIECYIKFLKDIKNKEI